MQKAPFLSVAIIACNDEAHIMRTLHSIASVSDEIVVVLDTKSSDDTGKLLGKFESTDDLGKLRVVRRNWTHSFSEARNAALELCMGEWIMSMDADEELAQGSDEQVREFLTTTQADTITTPLLVNQTYGTVSQFHEGFGDFCTTTQRNRFFRNECVPVFRFRVHEEPYFEDKPDPAEEYAPDLLFYHRGDMTTEKGDYYQALLTLDVLDHPESKMQPIYLADMALKDKKQEKAHAFLKKVDPEKFTDREAPLAAQWFFLMGKVGQLTWAKLRAELEASGQEVTKDVMMAHKAIADDAIVCYQQAAERNPLMTEALISEAVMHIISAGIAEIDTACAILMNVCQNDMTNVVAAELLEFCIDFLKAEQGKEPDLERTHQSYSLLMNRLGVYLTEIQNTQNLARLKADGIDPRVPNGRLKSVSLEELKEMESNGQVTNPESLVSLNERLRQGGQ